VLINFILSNGTVNKKFFESMRKKTEVEEKYCNFLRNQGFKNVYIPEKEVVNV